MNGALGTTMDSEAGKERAATPAYADVAARLGLKVSAPTAPAVGVTPTVRREIARPTAVRAMLGNDVVRTRLVVKIESARERGVPLGHVLLSGPPGLGKTSLARAMAHDLNARLIITTASAVNTTTKMANTLARLRAADLDYPGGTILFVDEIHSLSRIVQELLLTALEDYRIDVSMGDRNSQTTNVDLPLFTFVGATTDPGKLERPFVDRFAFHGELDYYSTDELAAIVRDAAFSQGMHVNSAAAITVGSRGRGTPRVALRLLADVRDYSLAMGAQEVTEDIAEQAMSLGGVDAMGLTASDRALLRTLVDLAGPTGIHRLAAAAGVEVATAKAAEPWLLRAGLIAATSRGRIATQLAIRHLDTGR